MPSSRWTAQHLQSMSTSTMRTGGDAETHTSECSALLQGLDCRVSMKDGVWVALAGLHTDPWHHTPPVFGLISDDMDSSAMSL